MTRSFVVPPPHHLADKRPDATDRPRPLSPERDAINRRTLSGDPWHQATHHIKQPTAAGDPPHQATGTVKWNRLPPSGLGSTHSRPPCASMMVRHTDRPMPMPSGLVVTKG